MKKIIVAMVLSMASLFAQASINTDGLTEAQIKELSQKAEQMKPPNPSKVMREELSEWGSLGKNVGEALLSASREVGVAVNEFSRTPVGMITTGIIVYKIIGKDILKILFGTLWLVFGGITSRYLYKAAYRYETENVTLPVLWGLWSYTKKVQTGKYTHSDTDGYLVFSIVVSAVSMVVAAITMF